MLVENLCAMKIMLYTNQVKFVAYTFQNVSINPSDLWQFLVFLAVSMICRLALLSEWVNDGHTLKQPTKDYLLSE